jgi:hypothetical protein
LEVLSFGCPGPWTAGLKLSENRNSNSSREMA